MSQPHELADASIYARLHNAEEPLVVETRFDGWEKPWRALTPEDWDDLALEFGERVLLGTIDTGRNRAFASRHGAEIVPEVLVFSRGEIVARFQGSADVRAIARAVREVLRHDRVLSEASRELAATDTSTARSVHRTPVAETALQAALRLARAS